MDANPASEQAGRHECPNEATLAAFLLGKLPDQAIEDVGRHITGCRSCQEALERLDVSDDSLIQDLRHSDQDLAEEIAFQELRGQLHKGPPVAAGAELEASQLIDGGPLTTERVPARLGQYELLGQIGRGGMGTVYRAWHVKLKREVALKLLSPKWLASAEAVARFSREMEAIGRLDDHPNIVRARDAAEADG